MPMLINRVALTLGASEPVGDLETGVVMETYSDQWPIYFHDKRQLHFGSKDPIDGLIEKIEAIRPILVIIDPLYSAVDMADYMAEAAQQMMILKSLRDHYGCNFVIAHHSTKAGETSRKRDAAWGSQFINAYLETGWQMRQEIENCPIVTVDRHFKVAQNANSIRLEFKITEYDYNIEIQELEAPTTHIENGRVGLPISKAVDRGAKWDIESWMHSMLMNPD